MHAFRLSLATLMAVVLSLAIAASAHAGNIKAGDKASFALTTIDGKTFESKALAGKIIVVDFWATWCGPCVQAMPHMKETFEKYSGKGVVIVGVSLDNKLPALEKFVKEKEIPWAQVYHPDQKTQLASEWGVTGIPNIVIISPEGEVLWRGHPAQMDKPLEDALKDHPPKLGEADQRVAAMLTLEKASKLVGDQDFAGALKAINEIPDEFLDDKTIISRGGRPLRDFIRQFSLQGPNKDKVRAALEENKEATAKLAKLAKAVNGSFAGATTQPSSEGAPGTPGAPGGTHGASGNSGGPDTTKLADARLAAGDRARAEKQIGAAYQHYKFIVERWGDTPAAEKARERIKEIENDPQIQAAAKKAQQEKEAKALMATAADLVATGKLDEAKAKYQEVVRKYPGSDEAPRAKEALSKF